MAKEKNKTYFEEKAKKNFRLGYNCAQSVLLAFSDEFLADTDTATLLVQGLGGGVGRMREVCGTVTGMATVVGMVYGSSNPNDMDAKADVYRRVQELAEKFRMDNGSIICRELLAGGQVSFGSEPEAHTPEYMKKRPCLEMVAYAAGLMAEMLIADNKI